MPILQFIINVLEFAKSLISSLFQIWGPDGFQLGIGWYLVIISGIVGLFGYLFKNRN